MNKKIIFLVSFIIISLTNAYAIDSVAYSLKVKGDVGLTRNFENSALKLGDELFNGDEIETKAESYAAIKFDDESSIIKLFPNTLLNIRTEKQGEKYNKKSLLKMGELWAKVEKGTGKFEIETPTTVASVKGTNFMLSVAEDGTTDIFTFEGEVLFQNIITGQIESVLAGQKGSILKDQSITVTSFDPVKIKKYQSDFISEEYKIPQEEIISEEEKKEDQNITPPIKPQTEEIEETDEPSSNFDSPFNMGGGLGTISVNDKSYTQIRLMPELTFGKFGVGLDIELLIDNEGNIRDEDWDEWEDYVNKIYYLRYGQRGDNIYGRFGGFHNYTLGHGLIMNEYSNMLRYPEIKQMGLQIGGNIPFYGIGAELFSSDITENDILAGQLSFLPLQKTEIPFLENIKIGLVGAIDINQNNGLLDSDDDGYYDYFDDFPYDDSKFSEAEEWYIVIHGDSTGFANWFENSEYFVRPKSDFLKNDIGAWGLNYELPLLTTNLFSFANYGEIAEIRRNPDTKIFENSGFIFPGFYAKFLIFQANLEFRHFNKGFAPAYFNQLYDQQRVTVNDDNVIVKEETLTAENYPASRGWLARISSNILNILELSIIYEDMYAINAEDESNKSLSGSLLLKKSFIPKLNSAQITYSQNQFIWNNFAFKAPSAFIEGKLSYNLSTNSVLVGAYQQRYVDLNGDGKIKGTDEIISTTNIGVEFKF
jgi:hypothetical protein